MSNDEDEEVVLCEDGQERPIDECVHCADSQWREMSACTQLHNGDWVENIEAFECNICGDCFHTDESCYGPDDDSLCQHCYEEHTVYCEECDRQVWMDDSTYCDRHDRYVCDGCYSNMCRFIVNYYDKRANNFPSETTDRMKFGIELEVESSYDRDDDAESVMEVMGEKYITCKEDASLGCEGFEIVTRPDSMSVHRRQFAKLFSSDVFGHLRSWETEGRCGMHVHVTRSVLTELQIGKMLCFLNLPYNERFVSYIAGRRSGSYCHRKERKVTDAKRHRERGSALNLRNSNTVEFRIFKGTLLDTSFYKNLEFVEALVAYCAPANRSIGESVSHKGFCELLSRKDYPNLYKFLEARSYVPPIKRRQNHLQEVEV